MTHGLVTQKRAEMVWNNRKTSSYEEAESETIPEPEQIQDLATECYLVERPEERIY